MTYIYKQIGAGELRELEVNTTVDIRENLAQSERILAVAKKYFKPEFINRLDEVVVFPCVPATPTV